MRTAVYAGTFDPMTNGHLSVIKKAVRLFDHLYVVVAVNPSKQPLFSIQERVEMIREVLAGISNAESNSTEDFVVNYARSVGAKHLVRGVRTCTDAESEIELANLNHSLDADIATVFIPADPTLSQVSSSRLKELAREGEDISRLCAPIVARKLQDRLVHSLAETTKRTSNVAF